MGTGIAIVRANHASFVFAGRDWKPVVGHKTVIEAHFDNKKLSTDIIPLTTTPKFNTELTWEADNKTIRSCKLGRVPIKIECYAVPVNEKKTSRNLLGYIILPISEAVEGVKCDSRWHKLLGGHSTTHKFPPCILLRLHLEMMALNQKNQINEKQMSALQNGQHQHDEDKMSVLQNKRGLLLQNMNGIEIRPVHVNGNDAQLKEERNAAIVHNIERQRATNGLYVEGEEQMDYDDEDIYDFDSEEEYSDDEENDNQGMIAEVYSLVEAGQASSRNDVRSHSGSTEPKNQTKDVNSTHHERNEQNKLASAAAVNERVEVHASESERPSVAGKPSEHESLLQVRADARDHLRQLSQNLRLSNPRKTAQQRVPSPAHDTNSPLEQRLQDTSSILDNHFQRKNTSKQNASFEHCKTPDNIYKTTTLPKDECSVNNDLLKSKLSEDPDATCTANFLSRSVRENTRSGPSGCNSKPLGNVDLQVLVPRLNDEGGYFSITPRHGEVEEEFIYSVTLIYAKNLSKIIPAELSRLLKEGFRFQYNLMGCSIYTDPLKDLDNPEFLSQKSSAVIRSSHQALSTYFTQHYSMPVYFLNGDVKLGVCVIDILELAGIASGRVAKVEDVYEVNSMNKGQFRDDSKTDFIKPVIAVSFEVKKSTASPSYYNIEDKLADSDKFSKLSSKRKLGGSFNEIEVSDSESDGEESGSIFRSVKSHGKGQFCYSCKSGFTKGGALQKEMDGLREAMKHEIMNELERWKKQKKKQFMKELATQEETLQKLLASEWSSKAKKIEEELSHRLSECDALQQKLNSALSQLSVKEEKLTLRERKVVEKEREANESLKTELAAKVKNQPTSSSNNQMLLKQLATEKSKNSELHSESSRLHENVRHLEETVQKITQELIDLRRKFIQTDKIIGFSKEKEVMQAKIESLAERKQYYKTQWVNTLTDLHRLHSAHKNVIDEISCGGEYRTPSVLTHKRMRNQAAHEDEPSSTVAGSKLRKLTGERKTLLESGIYSPSHSIIKNIDKKIQDLIQ